LRDDNRFAWRGPRSVIKLRRPNNHQAVVSRGAADWLVKIHELRQLLEPYASARACGLFDQEALEDLWALSRDAKPTRNYDWTEAAQYFDFALHLSIAEYCDDLPMAISIRKCWDYKRLSYELGDGCRPSMKKEYEEHVEILDALTQKKANTASRAMAKHLRNASLGRAADRVV
jgi:DNA-binding GntR family transcriptional regulator